MRGAAPFCIAPMELTSEENDLVDDYAEDQNEIPGLNDAGMAHHNSAGKLGKDLEKNGKAQIKKDVRIDGIEQILPVQSAAHHIIPGNASLKKSKRLMKYLHVDGMAKGNIGYNINNHENGIWLAGNYALRGKDGMPGWVVQG